MSVFLFLSSNVLPYNSVCDKDGQFQYFAISVIQDALEGTSLIIKFEPVEKKI